MINRTISEIAEMIGAASSFAEETANLRVQGVSKDTRNDVAGSLYIPLIGASFDGHAFAQDAFHKGAVASLWQKDHPNPPQDVPLIYVDDTLLAMQQLATAYRKQLKVRIIGITGSNGKTTTKDLVASVLSTTYKVHKTQGNYNNHFGLPLTILELDEDTDFAVVEMGMSGRGEIELLSQIAQPDIAIITMIGESHLLQLGSRLEIARAKMEILKGLSPDGVFIYNGDEPLIEQVKAEIMLSGNIRSIRFGQSKYNDYYTDYIRLGEEGTFFTVNGMPDPLYYIPLLGQHNATNALSAIAVAKVLGVSEEQIVDGLSSLQMTSMRIEKLTAASGLTILNDAYNASPASMRAALDLFDGLTGYKHKYVVLGDMLELGEEQDEFHREIGARLHPEHIQGVYAFGSLAKAYVEETGKRFPAGRVHWFEDKSELIGHLADKLTDQDVVLVKGSRGMKLEQVVHQLLEK
ncbi:UDP-N-acetylmuramoyl-tripeptide--D-alanyl-D-alanine ligase [Paenibacillus albiflavus]|uniref:UDP-N-acetylmuramoyl-tripeptide--D-alanyl-D-alanine ligase n=1 Tax=Paenibacillus albiflavus TaxID=2545760 RepID=A0A4R4EC73_9BACL|nr:UDP-N-acetylmuramoyl-tripeptide--D-alanyl-D-alanine ligase [Paenibacillus albiflavus]TCZ75535.1 UDP-N-acetylmuramoyl-tripeptide--D-alanyl-D-alanine ligase [Paenibacillus albiflavus]